MKLLQVEGARAPVPHSWRRHCLVGFIEFEVKWAGTLSLPPVASAPASHFTFF